MQLCMCVEHIYSQPMTVIAHYKYQVLDVLVLSRSYQKVSLKFDPLSRFEKENVQNPRRALRLVHASRA